VAEAERYAVSGYGSHALWLMGEAAGVVPARVSRRSGAGVAIQSWLDSRYERGCAHPLGPPFVALPDRRVWCGQCAIAHAGVETRCAGCESELASDELSAITFVETRDMRFVGRFCPACEQGEGNRHGEQSSDS